MTEPNSTISFIESSQSPLKNVVTIKSQFTPQTVSSGNETPKQKEVDSSITNIAKKIIHKNSPQIDSMLLRSDSNDDKQMLSSPKKENNTIQTGTLSNLTAIINTVDTAVNSGFDRETPTPSIIQDCRHTIIKMLDESVSGRNYPMKAHITDNSGKNTLSSKSNHVNENSNTTFSYYLQRNTLLNDKENKTPKCKFTQLYQQIQENEKEQEEENDQQSNNNYNYNENEYGDVNNKGDKERNYFQRQFDYQFNEQYNNSNTKQAKPHSTLNNMNNNSNNMIFSMNVNMNLVPPNYIDYNSNNNNININTTHINPMSIGHFFPNQHDFNQEPFFQRNQFLPREYYNKNSLYYPNGEMMNIQNKMTQMYLNPEFDLSMQTQPQFNINTHNSWNQQHNNIISPNSMLNYYPMKITNASMKKKNNNYQDSYMNQYANSNDYLNQPFGFQNMPNYMQQQPQNQPEWQQQTPNMKKRPKMLNKNMSNLHINEVIKNSNSICKDQSGCRFLQKKIEEDPSIAQKLIQNAFNNLIDIINDSFGNYLIQKLFDFMTLDQFCQLMALITNEIYQICCNSFGTRVIQKLIDYLTTELLVQTFTTLINPIIRDIILDINGGHILLKSIDLFNPLYCKGIYGEIALNIVSIASHKHGCCVLQKCLEKAQPKTKQQLISYLLSNCKKLIFDQCGNYIIQYIITLKDEAIHSQIADQLISDISSFSRQKYSSNVIEKCFECCNSIICQKLLHAMSEEKICIELLFDKFGNYVLQKALVRADEETQHFILNAISPHLDKLKNYPFGIKLYCKLISTYSYLSTVMMHKNELNQRDYRYVSRENDKEAEEIGNNDINGNDRNSNVR